MTSVVGTLSHAGEGLLAVARVVNLKSRINQRFAHCQGERSLILHQQHRRALGEVAVRCRRTPRLG